MFKILLIASCCILSVATFGQVEYRDSILLKNGAGILCRVVDVTDDVVFFEQENTAIVLSASLSEVSEIEIREYQDLNLSDSTKAKQVDAIYVQ